MKLAVCRLYETRRILDSAERNWSLLSFMDNPPAEKVEFVRNLLIAHRDELNVIIDEITPSETKSDAYAWLGE